MIIETLQGFVLHKTWSGETSAKVTFLTREQGIVTGVCKGGRKPEKQALLQPFIPLCLIIRKYAAYYFVQGVEPAAATLSLQGTALFSGLYINELLYHLVKPDVQIQIFDAYLATIRGLLTVQTLSEMEVLLRRFEWHLLHACGYGFSLEKEAQTQHPISPEKQYTFIPDQGFYPVSGGLSGRHILAMSVDKLDNPDTLKTAKYIMRKAIDHVLDGVAIQTRKLYNSLA